MTAEQLKNSILQEAISGRLVPQDPNDEPAEIVSTVPEDEVPFEIPSTWRWVNFFSVYTLETNLVDPTLYFDYNHIAPDNIVKKQGKLLKCNTVREDKVKSNNHLFHKGQIIYSKIRPLLRKAIIAPFDGLCSADMYPLSTTMDTQFALIYLLSDAFNNQVSSICASRVKMPKINKAELATIVVPLPPLAEQKRIVAKLEELLPIVEQYSKAQKELDELNTALPARLRNSILQEAMQGKLVPFTAYKETTLGQECEIIMGQSPDGSTYNTLGKGMEFHQGKALFGKMYLNKANVYTSTPLKVAPPDSIVMSVRAPVGTCNLLDRSICIGRGLAAIKPKSEMDLMYLYYLLESKDCLLYLDDHSTGTTFKAVSKKIVEDYAFPLPPLAEQQRIVAKIEELFTEIDKMI